MCDKLIMMTKAKKTMYKNIITIFLITIVISGCSSYESTVNEYIETPTIELANIIAEKTREQEEYRWDFWGRHVEKTKAWIKAINVQIYMYKNGHHEQLNTYFNYSSPKPTKKLLIALTDNNIGTDSWHMYIQSRGHSLKNEIYEQYTLLVKASLKNNKYTNKLRSLLSYYGCMRSNSVWAELDKSGVRYDLGENSYPELKYNLNPSELAVLRKELLLGNPPELNSNCPINLYKNKKLL